MKALLFTCLVASLLVPLSATAAKSYFDGRWRLDTERSTALDGWTAMDLILKVDGDKVAIEHDMRWRTTRVLETNTVNTRKSVSISNFFRIEQRHMAVYPPKKSKSKVSSEWLDDNRTLRVETSVPVEISQGKATMRLYYEYRLGVGNDTLTLIELHSTRNTPLVYRFRKLPSDDDSRP